MFTLQLSVSDTESIRAELKKIVVEVLEETLTYPDILFKRLSEVALDELQKNNPLLTESEEQYLTRKELSQFLKVSLVTLHNWQKNGELTPYKIGNRVLYKKSEVHEKMLKQSNLKN